MLRCIGEEYGAVAVDGGADQVMLPRLPNDPPLPSRASARPGVSARANAAKAAINVGVRRMGTRWFVIRAQYGC